MSGFYDEFVKDYNEAEMVVIGIGAQLHRENFDSEQQMQEIIDFFASYLDKKNYFIITTHHENLFENSAFNPRRIVNPLMIQEIGAQDNTSANTQMIPESKEPEDKESKQWDLYNKWLAGTLNRRLLLVELGEGFHNPNIFRWPFERIAFINRKAKMYRIHDVFSQLPENINERAVGVPENAVDFLLGVKEYLQIRVDEM